MKRLFLLLTLLSLIGLIHAQPEEWLWAQRAGGPNHDLVFNMVTDSNGNCYVTGYFTNTATFGNTTLTSNGGIDIFIAKMDANGNWLWAVSAGASSGEHGNGVTLDSFGNCFVTGFFYGIATFGSINLSSVGGSDIFVVKLDTNGNWIWAESAGGMSSDYGKGITTDYSGNCYVIGDYSGSGSFGSSTLISNGELDAFVAKLDTNGNWIWAVSGGGLGYEYCRAIALAVDGNSIVTGTYSDSATFGSTNLTNYGYDDIFIAKLDSEGNWLWVKDAGGPYPDQGLGVTSDSNGYCYITGGFMFETDFEGTHLSSNGGPDVFIAKLDPSGNLLWAVNAGGIGNDYGYDLAIDSYDNCFVTGYYHSTAMFGNQNLTSNGESDIFIAKLDPEGNWLWTKSVGGASYDIGTGIATDSFENIYVTGSFRDTTSFGDTDLTSLGYDDIFIAKIAGSVSIDDPCEEPFLPTIPSLRSLSAYPNPFYPSTTIHYDIREPLVVKLSIFNSRGQLIRIFGPLLGKEGENQITWNGTDSTGKKQTDGIYFYKMETPAFFQTGKMLMLK